MELTERKVKILQAVIRNYLETGEPVGSRTISKYTDLNLSSATIRNEMADLEEMGYIVQPHTSAGRIPTDKGYRLYVDDLMKEKVQELDNREKKVTERIYKIHDVAKKSDDYATEIFMHQFINEQIEEEELALDIVDNFTLAGDNIAAKITIDRELGSK